LVVRADLHRLAAWRQFAADSLEITDQLALLGVNINLIAATTTKTGLTVYARLDDRDYPKAIEVSDAQLVAVNLHPHNWHGDWNYTTTPSQTGS
jgi:hypothetical protein